MHGALLVRTIVLSTFSLLEQLVVDIETAAPGIPKNVPYAFLLETADDDFRTREFGMTSP